MAIPVSRDFVLYIYKPLLAQGCTRGLHTEDAPKVEPQKTPSTSNKSLVMTETADGKEVYTTVSAPSRVQKPTERAAAIPTPPPASSKEAEADEDDPDVVVPSGTACKRAGCKVTFVSNEENRNADGPGVKCLYHPGAVRIFIFNRIPLLRRPLVFQPLFHEGSKVGSMFTSPHNVTNSDCLS
jgi:hypothetical protein